MKNKKLKLIIGVCALAGIGAALFAFMYMNGFTEILKNEEYKEGQIKVACVGDSVTYGHGIKNQPQNNYPRILNRLLGEEYHVCNFGVSGSTVQPDGDQPYNVTGAYADSVEYNAEILVFMLGSNDSKPENWQGEEKFKNDYLTLLDSYLTGENPPKVYLCAPPKAFFPEGKTDGLTNYDIQPLIVDEIVRIVRQIASERGYELIDVYTLTENRHDLFNRDNVHPNNAGAEAIAEEVFGSIG